MFIPRYWFKISAEAETPEGIKIPFSLWRGSVESPAGAQREAAAAAQRVADRIQRGEGFPRGYAYAERPVREEIVREIAGGPDESPVVITRNVYGALVLNAAHVGFIDVDLPEQRRPGALERFIRQTIFRQPPKPPANHALKALGRLKEWIAAHPEWGVRIYRTKSGFRYLVTHAPLVPADAQSEAAMEALGADPHYRRLCQVQKSFRARLSPKPWRCGIERPPSRFPWENAESEQAMRAWEKRYHQAAEAYATCSLIDVYGASQVDPLIEPIIALHDQATRANEPLPLA